jgi:hypothetical protein
LGTDKAPPYEARWAVDEEGNRALQAVAVDRASRRASYIVDVLIDRSAPVRGVIKAKGAPAWQGVAKGYRFDLNVVAARDVGSGIAEESEIVTRQAGTWITGVTSFCALDAGGATIATLPPYAVSDSDVESRRCYLYVYEVEDKAGNGASFASSLVFVPDPPQP